MQYEEYVRAYIAAFATAQPLHETTPSILDADYYYPPRSVREPSLDNLARGELLELLQAVVTVEYPQQTRLSISLASNLPQVLKTLQQTVAQQQCDLETLQKYCMECETQARHNQALAAKYRAEITDLRTRIQALYASRSWRLTRPLRWLGRVWMAMRGSYG